VAILDSDGIVREFVEKPARPVSNLVFSGVLLAGPQVFDFIPDRRPADIGFDVLPKLAGKMSAHKTSDYFQDIGTLENYKLAQASWPGI
jgi:NDP-sugar pyrophosphorylase family protein